jgi:hypothetical protein
MNKKGQTEVDKTRLLFFDKSKVWNSYKKLQPKNFEFFLSLINVMAIVDRANGEQKAI